MTGVDFAALKASVLISSVVAQSVKLRRNGREFVGCCPFHDERTPSFTVNDDKGFAHCFGCGWHGDATDFVAALTGCSLVEAAGKLGGGEIPSLPPWKAPAPEDRSELIEAARRIWREAGPIAGTPAERYLRGRAISCALPETLRFSRLRHPEGGEYPCLVSLVTRYDNKFAGIQRTYLTEQGRKASVAPVKLSLGTVKGCAIRLAPVAAELVVCEGLEDGLTLQQELGRAVWVAAGASMLPGMHFPSVVRSVVIGADNDAAGQRETDKAAEAFTARGLSVRIMRPSAGFKDFNEQAASGEAGRVAA
jgi:DNA primase